MTSVREWSADRMDENRRCEAVVLGYKAQLVEAGADPVIAKLMDEIAGRIALARRFAEIDRSLANLAAPSRGGGEP